jgi:hypothetical protein
MWISHQQSAESTLAPAENEKGVQTYRYFDWRMARAVAFCKLLHTLGNMTLGSLMQIAPRGSLALRLQI